MQPTTRTEGIAESNSKSERHEAAMAELITMFGDATHTVTVGTLNDEARLEVAYAALQRTRARLERVTELEKSLLPGFLADLFLALDAKHSQAVMELDQLNRTVDIERVASRLRVTSGDKVQAARDRREWEGRQARSENGKKAAKLARPHEKATEDYAVRLWEQEPKGKSMKSVARKIEARVVAYALKRGWRMKPDNQHRTIYDWILEANRKRIPK